MVKKSTSVQEISPEDRRIARRERRREQSREEILDAAEALIERDGISAVTVDAVAKEVALTKAALYYYFASKDELAFSVVFRKFIAEARAIRDAVAEANDGAEALRAIIRCVIERYADNLHGFRLNYLHPQVSGAEVPKPTPEMLERVRPLNGWMYGRAQELLEKDREAGLLPDDADPRRLAFTAHMAALGVLTMKGMVESSDDPLIHSDEDLIRELELTFTRAARK